MAQGLTERGSATSFGDTAITAWDSLLRDGASGTATVDLRPTATVGIVPAAGPDLGEDLPDSLLADLDEPNLVFSAGYVGPDRRAIGPWGRLRRVTFHPRRWLLRLELVVVAVVAVMVTASLLLVGSGPGTSEASAAHSAAGPSSSSHADNPFEPALPSASPASASAATPQVAPTPTAAPGSSPAAAAPAGASAASTAPTTPIAASAPAPVPTTAPPAAAASLTPEQMGAQALSLVRYPWQNIPGYSIQFLPISDAPSAGFYGNTTFTWGQVGGTSVMYVYPGETVERLAAITAFEIGHEVDAAAVEPEGGEAQIENVLGIHPASWAPDCDCAEQDFLSGWYAAAFSNYWSPGVGSWSQLAPEPSGAVLAAVEPWFDPTIP